MSKTSELRVARAERHTQKQAEGRRRHQAFLDGQEATRKLADWIVAKCGDKEEVGRVRRLFETAESVSHSSFCSELDALLHGASGEPYEDLDEDEADTVEICKA